MFRSKASIALMRLKEIDERYQRNINKSLASINTDSSTSDSSKLDQQFTVPKFKLEIKVPRTLQENDHVSTENSKIIPETVQKNDDKSSLNAGSDKSNSNSSTAYTKSKKDTSTSIILTVNEKDETLSEGSFVKSVDLKENVLDDPINSITSSFAADEQIKDTDERVPRATIDSQKLSYENDTFEEVSHDSIASTSHKQLETTEPELRIDKINNEDLISSKDSLSLIKIIEIEKDLEGKSSESIDHYEMVNENPRTYDDDKEITDDASIKNEQCKQQVEFIEILPPKLMSNPSECQIGLDKKLSKYVEIFERNDGNVEPVSLLNYPNNRKMKNICEKRQRFNKTISSTEEHGFTSNSESTKKGISYDDDDKSSTVLRIKKQVPRVIDDQLLSKGKFPKESSQTGKMKKGKDSQRKLVKSNKESVPAMKKQNRNKLRRTLVKNHRPKNQINDDQVPLKNRRDDVKPTNTPQKKEKYSAFNKKQIQRFNKQVTTLQIQEERNRIFHYLKSLERTRSGLKSCATIDRSNHETTTTLPPPFSPLDFPKIAQFRRSESTNPQVKHPDARIELQRQLSTIRQWLKDQFILYRDYSDMALGINAQYVDDTRKTKRGTRAKRSTDMSKP